MPMASNSRHGQRMIAIIDYGMGNLRSVQKGFEQAGYRAIVTSRAEEVSAARAVVLPGVGAFRDGMDQLIRRGLVDPIREAIAQGKPFLGICLGLQLLFRWSEEFGLHAGLGLLEGRVIRLPVRPQEKERGKDMLKIPHIGWNTLSIRQPHCPLFRNIPPGSYVYFVHSYYAQPEDSNLIVATTSYGLEFPCALWKDSLFATQFHPEKSQRVGLQILKNFGDLLQP